MARIDTLSNFLTDVADSIREKTGNTEPISCEDFDTEIESISGGGVGIDNCSSFFESGIRTEQFSDLFPLVKKPKIAQKMFKAIQSFNSTNVNLPSDFDNYLKSMDTSQTTDMSEMFANIGGNTELMLDLSNFDTHSVTTMSKMFSQLGRKNNYEYWSLSSLDISNFNTSNVTDMSDMFSYLWLLGNVLDLSHFNTANDKTVNMSQMFYNLYCINTIKLGALRPNTLSSTFNTVGAMNVVTEVKLDISRLDTSQCTSLYQTFHSPKIKTLDISNFNTINVTNMQGTFDGMNNVTTITISTNFVTNNVTTMQLMFRECYKLETFDFSNFNTSKVTSMVQMFSNCRVITKLDLSSFTSEKVTAIGSMFQNCYKLEEIDLSNFNFTTKITSFGNMFTNCGTQTSDGLTKVYVKDTDAQNWILTKSNGKPNTWSTTNVIVAGSSDDLRGSE